MSKADVIEVEGVVSMIQEQNEVEEDFDTKGYTIKKPNVILNPYGNSPLTAMIMFETKSKVSPKVTIKGKDEHSTFTNTFSASKKHYLPIYGLYADYNNEVVIEYKENGKKIKEYTVLEDYIMESDPGEKVSVKIYRDGRYYTTDITVGSNNAVD